MKKLLLLVVCALFASINVSSAQETLESLKAQKADKMAMHGEAQAKADALKGEIDALQLEIDKLSGWITGLSGLVGFDFNKSNGWVGSPNPDASSSKLGIGITAFANKTREKSFWNNKVLIDKQWQDVDLSDGDQEGENDGLFDNGTVDIVNMSSLYGYKLNSWIAASGLGEVNTSIENFLDPGTLDIGVGATLTPMENLVVVIHPLNYHIAFSGVDGVESSGALGAKLRADYAKEFSVRGKKLLWSSTFTTFIPYQDETPSLTEYTWLNKLNFEVWRGIGVGISAGLRNSEYESPDTQNFYSIGLSYGF